MCGFVGVISKTGRRIPDDTLARMTHAIAHRGPDDQGFHRFGDWLAMGFRRLSILDLSPSGHQPMLDDDGRKAIVFNGEVYNYREIRAELESKGHRFRSGTDTEVVLKAYIQWGPDCVRKFSGMFAVMIADSMEKTVWLCRDQLGIKPLFQFETPEFLVFCSEIKALLPFATLEPDKSSFNEYLVFRSVLGRRTLFNRVQSMLPGHHWLWKDGRLSENQYFNLADTLNPISGRSFEQVCGEVEEAFTRSVEIHLRSDVEVGVQLSGGVDSSLITAIAAAKSTRRLHSFSVSFGEPKFDESKYQEMVSERYGTIHHDFPMDNDRFTELIPETIWHYEQPLNDPNTVFTNHLMKHVKRHLTVILAGEGADEAFLGYMRFLPDSIRTLRRRTWLHRHDTLRKVLHALWPIAKGRSLLNITRYTPAMYVLSYPDLNDTDTLLRGDDSSFEFRRLMIAAARGDTLKEAILQDQACDLPQWFQRADRVGMASSVEVRVPFCSADMFRTANSIPYETLVNRGERKAVLKKIAEKHLDRELIYRKKIGFDAPLDAWAADSSKGWARLAIDTLESDRFHSRNDIDHEHFQRVWLPFKNKIRAEQRPEFVWTHLNLELWRRMFFEGGWKDFANPADHKSDLNLNMTPSTTESTS